MQMSITCILQRTRAFYRCMAQM